MKKQFIIVIISLILGNLIAVFFGVNEDLFKNQIANDLKTNSKILAIEDLEKREKKIDKEKSKNWRYYQRFHFHSTGIGAISLGVLFLLMLINSHNILKIISSYMISIGGALYPFIWLFAAIYGPSMGRSEAKEAFAIFGYMGGIYLVGLTITLFLLCKYPLKNVFEEK